MEEAKDKIDSNILEEDVEEEDKEDLNFGAEEKEEDKEDLEAEDEEEMEKGLGEDVETEKMENSEGEEEDGEVGDFQGEMSLMKADMEERERITISTSGRKVTFYLKG